MNTNHRIIDCETNVVVLPNVESARTTWQRFRGLMFRRRPVTGGAIWISPCRSIHTMWMRFTIDVYFLDPTGTVLESKTLPPWRVAIAPNGTAQVLEVPTGLALIESGTRLRLEVSP